MVHAGRRPGRLRRRDARRHGRAAHPGHAFVIITIALLLAMQVLVNNLRRSRTAPTASTSRCRSGRRTTRTCPSTTSSSSCCWSHRLRGLGAADEVRYRPAGHPRGRGQGGRDRRQHHPVQGARVRGQRRADRRRRRRLRLLPVVPQPDRRLQPAHQRHDRAVGAARRPRDAVGPGARRLRGTIGTEVANVYGGGTDSRLLVLGLALVLVVLFLPRGVLPTVAARLARRRAAQQKVEYTDQAGGRDRADADRRSPRSAPARRAAPAARRCWRSGARRRASAACGPSTASTSPSRPGRSPR